MRKSFSLHLNYKTKVVCNPISWWTSFFQYLRRKSSYFRPKEQSEILSWWWWFIWKWKEKAFFSFTKRIFYFLIFIWYSLADLMTVHVENKFTNIQIPNWTEFSFKWFRQVQISVKRLTNSQKLKNCYFNLKPVALKLPIWGEYNKTVSSRYINKVRRNCTVARQYTIMTDGIILKELQRSIHKHDTKEFFAFH